MPTARAVRAEAPSSSRGRATRYRLVALALDAADVVAAAGGLLFDRASCGWNVDVHLTEPDHGEALRILGVPQKPLSEAVSDMVTWPDVIMVSAALHRDDQDVKRLFATASRRILTGVALWGGDWPDDAGSELGRVERRPSRAASAFKRHAVAAAGLPPATAAIEEFRIGTQRLLTTAALTHVI